ncbi:MAG: hypothetical protein AAGF97_07735 [Planctomycetota bacterium]
MCWKRFMVVLLLASLAACQRTVQPGDPQAEAAARVLAADEALGTARNRGTETDSLTQVIEVYVAGIDALDFSGCPPAFTEAFRAHRDAWANGLPFFAKFPERRGEMHDLFDQIRETHPERLQAIEAEIWGTWDEVEKATPSAE